MSSLGMPYRVVAYTGPTGRLVVTFPSDIQRKLGDLEPEQRNVILQSIQEALESMLRAILAILEDDQLTPEAVDAKAREVVGRLTPLLLAGD